MPREATRPSDHTDEAIQLALIEARGVIKAAARKLKCGRSPLSRYISASEELTQFRKDCFNIFLDEVEETYFDKMIETKDKIMLIFFLKCHGKERGWVERQEITGKDGEAIGQVLSPRRDATPEEWMKANAA